jgi:hypothetical protein
MLSSGIEDQNQSDKVPSESVVKVEPPQEAVVEPLHANLPRPNFKNPLLQKKSDKPK